MYEKLFIILIVGVYIFLTGKYRDNKMNGYAYWSLSLLILFLLRFKLIMSGGKNQDEDQWMVSASSMMYSFRDWCIHFAPYDTFRIFTILPLVILSPILNMTAIGSAHLLAVLLAWLFIYLSHRINELVFDRQSAMVASALLVIVFGLTSTGDIVAYNSEYPVIVLAALVLFLLVSFTKKPGYRTVWTAFLLGVVCSWIPFAKEQAVILALLLAAICSVHMAILRQWRSLMGLATGGVTGLLLVLLPVIFGGGLSDLIFQAKQALRYSSSGSGIKIPGQVGAAKMVMKLSAYVFNADSLLLVALMLGGLAGCLATLRREMAKNKEDALIRTYYMLIAICTIYTVYAPPDPFDHYGIFIYFPAAFFIALLPRSLRHDMISKYGLVALAATHMLIIYCYGPGKPPKPRKYDEVETLLRKYAHRGDGALIWGWDNSIYLKYELRRASRYLYPSSAVGDGEGAARVRGVYLDNIAHFKPRIVIELVGRERFCFTDTSAQVRYCSPQLQQQLDLNYTLKGAGDNYKFYLRK